MQKGDAGPIDLDKTTTTLEPDKTSSGGLFVPGKERVVFKPSERKSLLGLDALAIAKRGGATVESEFKVPRERLASFASSLDEDEESSAASGIDELGHTASNVSRNNVQRRYRESYASETSVSGTSFLTLFSFYIRGFISLVNSNFIKKTLML
uniref:Putative ovule protein n=1 Tax=Solanum chacoense TaxID=4108 RepID=A0A0V0HLF9_SOLCH